MLVSKNASIQHIAKMAKLYRNSIASTNLYVISKTIDCDMSELFDFSIDQIKCKMYVKYSVLEPIVAQINELSQVLYRQDMVIDGFQECEIKDLRYHLCTG
jgi:hypothetical protein